MQSVSRVAYAVAKVMAPKVTDLAASVMTVDEFEVATEATVIDAIVRNTTVVIPAEDPPLKSPPPPIPPPESPPLPPPPLPNPWPNLPTLGEVADVGALAVNVAGDDWSSGDGAWIPIF
eukprot:6902298-Prymnesium_polylepis.1